MVIIVRKSDKVVTWAFDLDISEISFTGVNTTLQDLVILDMNTTTADIYEVNYIPDDFEGGKYIFKDNKFEEV